MRGEASGQEWADHRIRFLVRSTEDPLESDGPNVIRDLTRSPKRISPVYVFDKRGTQLFEQQCRTPEYYLRRVEARLLRSHAGDICEICGGMPIVELGAGTAEKTQVLFAEYEWRGMRCDYYPIDVDTETLSEAMKRLAPTYPSLYVHCLGTTFQKGLRALPPGPGARLFLFLGSSLGNMRLSEIDDLLRQLFETGTHGDYLLLGVDLDKDAAIINSAYNDSAGYGPRSTLNMLRHLNRRYDGNFVPARFRYVSNYDSCAKRNDVSIESLVAQEVTLGRLGLTVSFAAAERIEAEIMWKFDPDALGERLDRAGFSKVRRWIDPVYRYGLFLLRRK
jgi:L-histidine N-alpha-methyltransferase